MTQTTNFTFTRGQSIKAIITLERLSNDNLPYNSLTNPYVPVNLTGCTAQMMWRKTVDSSSVILDASTTNGRLTITDPSSGKINLILTPVMTEVLSIKGESIEYGYDLEVIDTSLDKTYPIAGTITLVKDFTR